TDRKREKSIEQKGNRAVAVSKSGHIIVHENRDCQGDGEDNNAATLKQLNFRERNLAIYFWEKQARPNREQAESHGTHTPAKRAAYGRQFGHLAPLRLAYAPADHARLALASILNNVGQCASK